MRRCARCERVADALRREWTSDVYYPEDEIPIADARRYLRERMEARKHCRRRRSQEGNND